MVQTWKFHIHIMAARISQRIFYTLSDQRVFIENGVPAVLFTSGITMNNNKTYDSADTLDYNVLRKRIILIFHWIEKML